jgi:hypothetical protein
VGRRWIPVYQVEAVKAVRFLAPRDAAPPFDAGVVDADEAPNLSARPTVTRPDGLETQL